MEKKLTKEHLENYRAKLEAGLADYMGMPASERNAAGVKAMIEGWLILDAVDEKLCGAFNRAAAEKWVAGMKNSDGTTGAHWSVVETNDLADSLDIARDGDNCWRWWAAVNMIYSDYYAVASHFGVATPAFFAELARAFLEDEDGPGPREKLAAYHCAISRDA